MSKQKVLIVGGVAGGASAGARLRRLDEECEIIMFERGEYISFANCGLPYYIGDKIKDKNKLTLQTPESFRKRFNIDVRIFNEVIDIDRNNKKVKVRDLKTDNIYEESYDKLILVPGVKPFKPNIEGIELEGVFSLRNIPDTYKIKDYIQKNKAKNALIVGGGYIGIEMAENLYNIGLNVCILENANQIIAPLDFDMACEVRNYIEDKGVEIKLESSLEKIAKIDKGLLATINGEERQVDLIILAIGVIPDTKFLENTGIELNERGSIVISDNMLTNDKDIYAVGDAVEITNFVTNKKGFIPLAGPANKQGRIVADNICNKNSIYDGTQGSSILKVFNMTVAITGINEKMAKSLGLNYDKVFTYSGNHASYYPNSENMSIKTIYNKKDGKILGAQIVGFEGVDKRCDVLATAIRFGAYAKDLTKLELCYAPPYSSAKDPVNMVGFVIENILENGVENFYWEDIENLQNDKDVFLLDVRTEKEYKRGHIENFINIPLDELRENLGKIDKDKKIYITCQIGLRGYIAYNILTQKGYKCYNLSGGYRLYNTIHNKTNIDVNSACINPK